MAFPFKVSHGNKEVWRECFWSLVLKPCLCFLLCGVHRMQSSILTSRETPFPFHTSVSNENSAMPLLSVVSSMLVWLLFKLITKNTLWFFMMEPSLCRALSCEEKEEESWDLLTSLKLSTVASLLPHYIRQSLQETFSKSPLLEGLGDSSDAKERGLSEQRESSQNGGEDGFSLQYIKL